MRSQAIIISAYLAIVILSLILLFEFVYLIPFSSSRTERYSIQFYIRDIIESRGNWTAVELANAIANEYSVDYVNVTIIAYNVLNNNKIVYRDNAMYRDISMSLSNLIINKFSYSILYRNGYYVLYLIEVGYR